MRKPNQTNSIFREVALDAFFPKKGSRDIKVAKYWSKTTICLNKMMDGLIFTLENFKALMEFKAQYFDGDRNTHTV